MSHVLLPGLLPKIGKKNLVITVRLRENTFKEYINEINKDASR
jgi:hypothetical protein